MTNKERLISLLGFAPPKNSAEGALQDLGLGDADTYIVGNLVTVKKAAIEVMNIIITTADTGNNEVGWTAKYDRPSILKRIAQLEDEITDTHPTIKGIQPW